MAVYLGNMAFEETTGSVLTVDPWGMDQLVRRIMGRGDQGPAYIATLARKRTVRDGTYPNLYLTDYSITMNGAVWEASLTYRGIFDSSTPPDPVFEIGTRVQEISLPFIGNDLGITSAVTATFGYVAPFSRILYVLPAQPTAPLYRGYVQVTRDSLQIVSRTGAAGDLTIFRGKFLNTGIPLTSSERNISGDLNSYNAVAESITSQFDAKPVGQWWQVTEQNEVRLQPLDLAQAGFTVQL